VTAKHHGRRGRPYLRGRAFVLAASEVCWICGHPGARTIDHVITVKECRERGLLHLLNDPANMRPAHGAGNRCPECKRHCNQDRGTGEDKTARRSRDW